jgi:RimJ/RimL family protein N-acetyltransferase
VILFESSAEDGPGVDVHLGYVLAESAWGQGLGSELVEGFVECCRGERRVRTLIAGVAADNPASIRILEKNGFRPMGSGVDDPDDERMFSLRLR